MQGRSHLDSGRLSDVELRPVRVVANYSDPLRIIVRKGNRDEKWGLVFRWWSVGTFQIYLDRIMTGKLVYSCRKREALASPIRKDLVSILHDNVLFIIWFFS